MASGHVNRIQRPNTWLHRPSLQREISLANSEIERSFDFLECEDVSHLDLTEETGLAALHAALLRARS